MALEHVNSPELAEPRGYSHAVVASGSRFVHISGQVSVDRHGNLVGEGDLAAQAKQAMLNLAAALRAAGAEPSDLAKLNVYVLDYGPDRERDLYGGMAAAAKETGLGPTATILLGVSALGIPGALVEVDGIAVVT